MVPFDEWLKRADAVRTGDPLWSVQAYRLGVYLVECHTFDRQKSAALSRAATLDQLTRAVGSISANWRVIARPRSFKSAVCD
jgi:hypothetical protein